MNILMLEDDPAIAQGLRYSLESEGYTVTHCATVTQALEAVGAGRFDLCLLDLTLPDGSGYDVCKKIKSIGDRPVIFLTAYDDEVNVVMGFDLGADDYITKPYNPTILLLRINALLKRAAASSANNSTFYRGMEILPQKGVIKYNDGRDEMLLTKNEMTIFMCLLAKKDRIVSRDELMTELWNNEEYLNDNALTVNISRLRARFKDIGIEDVIETRKGQGYILV